MLVLIIPGFLQSGEISGKFEVLGKVRKNQGGSGKIRKYFLQLGKIYLFVTKSGNFHFSWIFV